ncbi:MAG: DeoR/GlpR family DNA-binding transcription regulator [Chloroflexota bacterium]
MSKNFIPAQRRQLIQEYLTTHKIASVTDLSGIAGASEATVRRDLEWLENDGVLERTYGGAVLNQRYNLESAYEQRAGNFPEEKRRIGALAASLVEDGDIVFINSGTTTAEVLLHIRKDARITIVTNNTVAASQLGDDVMYEIFLLGGILNTKVNAVTGPFALDNLSKVYADKSFIGVDGISMKFGCTVPTMAEAELMRMMIARTQGMVAVVTDHSKWGVVSNFEVAKFDQIHKVITDEGLDAGARESLKAQSVEVILAKDNNSK